LRGRDRLFKIAGARHGWLMPIILATQEAESRRITVRFLAPLIIYMEEMKLNSHPHTKINLS
jgi:hypothetical protein